MEAKDVKSNEEYIPKNLDPKPDMEYIIMNDIDYDYDFETSSYKQILKKGSIVTNVKLKKGKENQFMGYDFVIKDTGELRHTYYPWILAENTPENIEKIKNFREEYRKFELHEQYVNSLRNEIVTLKKNNQKPKAEGFKKLYYGH